MLFASRMQRVDGKWTVSREIFAVYSGSVACRLSGFSTGDRRFISLCTFWLLLCSSSIMSADEDLDDLDDILDDFSAPKPAPKPAAAPAAAPTKPSAQPQPQSEDDLSRNMAALLASLGGPPGLGSAGGLGGEGEGGDEDLAKLLAQLMGGIPDEDLDDVLEGEGEGMDEAGFEALLASLGQPPAPQPSTGEPKQKQKAAPPPQAEQKPKEQLSFEETIKQTMNNMRASSSAPQPTTSDSSDPLAQLLASLNIDPSELSSLGLGDLSAGVGGKGMGEGDGGDFSGVLDGMMKQLMTREILEEPLAELAEKVRLAFLPSLPYFLLSHSSPSLVHSAD